MVIRDNIVVPNDSVLNVVLKNYSLDEISKTAVKRFELRFEQISENLLRIQMQSFRFYSLEVMRLQTRDRLEVCGLPEICLPDTAQPGPAGFGLGWAVF